MPGLSSPLSVLTSSTVANGYAMALALVVLLQYVHALTVRRRTVQTAGQFRRDVEGLSLEVLQLSRDRGLQKLENQILREVMALSDCQKAMGHLLRRFVVNPEDAFGCFMPLDPATDMPYQSRGLSTDSLKNLSLDAATLQQLREHGAIVWETPTTNSCPLYVQLCHNDRRKARQMFLVGVGDERGLLGVLMASSLLPIAGTRTEQVDLTTRLLSSLAPNLRQTLEMERQSVQLRCTREMLELRTLTDGKITNPSVMLERFLSRLGQMVDAERTSLFLASHDAGGLLKCSLRSGIELHNGILLRWNEHEERLATYGAQLEQMAIYDTAQLCRLGIDTLIGSAAVLPLYDAGKRLGVVLLTRRSPQGFSVTQRQLLSWAAESVSHTLERAMSFVAIEKQARQDALTGLANRRMFDESMDAAFTSLKQGEIREFTLLLMDMDHFKSINDIHGHQVGDTVLKTTADLIRAEVSKIRASDRHQVIAARYGGEEMALLLPGVGINGGVRIAESIRKSVEKQVIPGADRSLKTTISIGAAAAPIHATDAKSLIESADEALYRAKHSGRNRVMLAEAPIT